MADREAAAASVLAAIQTGIKTRGDLRALTGLNYSTINDALDDLVAAGQVETAETTMKTYYRLSTSDEQPPSPGAPPKEVEAAVEVEALPVKRRKVPGPVKGKRPAKKGARKGAVKAGRAGRTARKPIAEAAPPASVAPPPFSQNGFASALRAAALEFEYQALWGEPSPKAGAVRAIIAEAVSHLSGQS